MKTSLIMHGVIYKDVVYVDFSNPNERIDIVAKEVSFLGKNIQPLGWRYGAIEGVYATTFLPKRLHHKEKRTKFKESTVKLLQQVLIKGYTHKMKDNDGEMVYVVSVDKLLEDTGETKVLRQVRPNFPKRKAMSTRTWYAKNTSIIEGRLFKYEKEDYYEDKVMLCSNNMNIAVIQVEGLTSKELKSIFSRLYPLDYLRSEYGKEAKATITLQGTRFGYDEMP